MTLSLTPRQDQLLAVLRENARQGRVGLSYDDMREAIGVAGKSTVFRLLTGLEERGLIRRKPNRARAIELVDDDRDLAGIPTQSLIAELKRRGFLVSRPDITPGAGDGAVANSHTRPRQADSVPVHADGYAWGEARNHG